MDPAASLHEGLDPISEAEGQLAGVRESAHTIVLLGAGLGFVTELAATRWPAAKVIVLEPSAEIARVALHRAPSLYESGRVRVLVGPEYAGAADLWKVFDRPEADDASGLAVVRHTALTQTMPTEIAKAYRLVARAIEAAKMNRRAREENAGRYLLNTLRNLPAIHRSGDPASLVGQLTGIPAIVVGAGPSLDRQLDDLRALADRAVIVAADTAWRPLVTSGIDPHFVVALDPTEANGRHLRGVHPSRETWGVAEGSVIPAALSAFGDSLFTFRVGGHHPWPWLETLGVCRPVVRAWGSVLTSAFDLALAFGCDPILFAGADLAFTDGRPYCRGTTFEEDWAQHTARGASLRQVWHNTLAARKLLTEGSVNGDAVFTAPHMIEFRNWIVRRAGEALSSSQRVFNTTPGGILAGGAIQRGGLKTLLEGRPASDAAIRRTVHESVKSGPPGPASHILADALANLESKATSNDLIDEWLTFGRPSLTLDIIQAAAKSAREDLTKPASPKLAGLRASEGGPPAVCRLPPAVCRLPYPSPRIHPADRVARMRAHLTGDTAGLEGCANETAQAEFGDIPPADATKRLLSCLLALPRLTTGWGRDVEQGSDPATIPLSLRYAWTEDAKPVADSLEGWLLHPIVNDRLRQGSIADESSHFWGRPCGPTSDEETSDTDGRIALSEQAARRTLTGLWVSQVTDKRSKRLLAIVEPAVPNELDAIMRAVTGTIATPWQSAGDPRMGFVQNEIGYIEPDVLTDRGLPLGWNIATADANRAIFTPRLFNHSLAIAGDGRWSPIESWPDTIVGEVPWGDEGGALAWNTTGQFILSRSRRAGDVRRDDLSFHPSRVLQTREGVLVLAALDGGLWEWTPGTSGQRLIETPKCAGVRFDGQELVLAPIVHDAAGQLLRRRLRYEFRYQIGESSLRRSAAGPEGPFGSQSTQGSWTARSHPFADLIMLQASDGRSFVLAVHSPFQVAWAGTSLIVTITDGVTLIFPRLIDRIE
jgi:hypothetical protein